MAGLFFLVERSAHGHAHDKPLGAVIEVVQIDHGHLVATRLDPVSVRVRDVAPDQPIDVSHRALEASDESVDGTQTDIGARPIMAGVILLNLSDDQIDQITERPRRLALNAHRSPIDALCFPKLRHHIEDHHRVLGSFVFGVGEEKKHQVLLAELLQRPEKRCDVRPGADIGHSAFRARARRGVQPDRLKRPGREAEDRVTEPLIVVEMEIRPIDMEQVFTLHVEDECLGIDHGRAKHTRVEQRVKEKCRVARFGRHSRNPGDTDMGPSLAVEELEVGIERFAVSGGANGKLPLHSIKEQRLVALIAAGSPHRVAWPRRDKDLRLDPGDRHLGGLDDLGREHSVLDQEYVGVESGALVSSPDLTHRPEQLDNLSRRKDAFQGDDIVEFEIFAFGHAHPELERRGVDRSENTTHHFVHVARVDTGYDEIGYCARFRLETVSLVVFPFKDEPASLVANNIRTAARHQVVEEVWAVVAGEDNIANSLLDATRAISDETSTPIEIVLQQRIGSLRPGKGDAMNTAIRRAAEREWQRVHFYDADITNFDESWIDGAESAADRGFGVVRHRFPRASTDAMITWMITRPGLAIEFPETFLPRLNQPLGGELLLTRPALEALADSPTVGDRSDWGIDTLITYETSVLESGVYEHHVPDGKRHTLYGSLDDIRTMSLECLDAVASLHGRPAPGPEVPHGSDRPTPAPPDLKRTVAYDIEGSLRLLTSGWTPAEAELASGLPDAVEVPFLENRVRPNFAFMDADLWFAALGYLIDNFRLGDSAWESLAFRLWLSRVLAYTTGQALSGYSQAMRYLESTIGDYEKTSR